MNIHAAQFVTSAPDLEACPPGSLPEFAFIGRSNVGKSSLINMLAMKKGLAKISETPGKTQLINFFSINGKWLLVDLPGYGFARVSKEKRADFSEAVADYLAGREALRHTFVLIDSRHPPQGIDRAFVAWMIEAGLPFSLVFTKTDKQSEGKTGKNVAQFRREVLADARSEMGLFRSSAMERSGRREILAHIEGLLADV